MLVTLYDLLVVFNQSVILMLVTLYRLKSLENLLYDLLE
jgi:hypothetical protein